MAAHRINVLLNKNLPQKIIKEINELSRIQQVYNEIFPLFAEHSTVAAFSQSKLSLMASNGATALKLKQMVPTLKDNFRKRGIEVTAIRVQVQVYNSSDKNKSLKVKKINDRAAKHLQELSDKLPESSLKAILEQLAKRKS
jgi:hypothetical protein